MGRKIEDTKPTWIITVGTFYPKYPDRKIEMLYLAYADTADDAVSAVADRLAASTSSERLSFTVASAPRNAAFIDLKHGEVRPYIPQ